MKSLKIIASSRDNINSEAVIKYLVVKKLRIIINSNCRHSGINSDNDRYHLRQLNQNRSLVSIVRE